MSIFSKGIDAQVKQRMMQDPRRLQQSYKQNRNILDLIALQMVKSEQDKKKKDMMLKMQQTPGTIKQQREQQLVQQTKDDLVKQTAGILGIKNAQQQKNMRRLMASAGKGRPPMGGIAQPFNRTKPTTPSMANPLATGLARAPAPNMQGMTRRAAQGGIIGFHRGDAVNKMGGRHDPNDHSHLTGGPNVHGYGQIIDKNSLANMLKNKLFPPPPPPPPIPGGMGEGQIDTDVKDMIKKGTPEAYLEKELDTIKKLEEKPKEKPEEKVVPGSGIELIGTDLGDLYGGIQTTPSLNTVPVEGTQIAKDVETASKPMMEQASGLASIDLADKQKSSFKTAQEQLAMTPEQRAVFEENIQARKTRLSDAEKLFDDAYGNKNENRMDDLISFLVGAGGTGNIGKTFQKGVEGSRRSEGARIRAMKEDRTKLESLFDKSVLASETLINKDLGIKQKAFDASMKDKEIYGALKGKGMQIMGDLTVERMKGLSQDAVNMFNLNLAKFKEAGLNDRVKMQTEADMRISKADNTVKVAVANLEGSLAKERMELDDELKRAIEAGNQIEVAEISLRHVEKTMAALKTKYADIYDTIISTFQRDLVTFSTNPEIQKNLNALITRYENQRDALIGESLVGLESDAERLRLTLKQLGGGTGNLSADQMAEINKILGIK